MRVIWLTIVFLACCALPATAQPASHSWESMQAIPVGTNIQVVSNHDNRTCRIKSVDADTLVCGKETIPRAEVKRVKLLKRGESALVELGIGAVASLLAALIADKGCKTIGCVGATAIVAAAVLVLGPILAFETNFMGHTVYKRT